MTGSPHPQGLSTPTPASLKDNDGPYKSAMIARVESIPRGQRIQPPCDRCRRLHMDCVRNLTACLGCTKKHAKCSWKDVRSEEISTPINTSPGVQEAEQDTSLDYLQRAARESVSESHASRTSPHDNGNSTHNDSRALAMNAAAAALAAVPKSNTNNALDSTESDLQQVRAANEQHSQLAQSPNLIPPHSHQSPNITSYGAFSPTHTSHASVNMPYASGCRISSPMPALAGADEQHNTDARYDVQSLDKETIDIRPSDGLLAS
jgi:hypothetical protein